VAGATSESLVGRKAALRRQVYECLSSSPIFGLSAICGLDATRHRNRSEVLSGNAGSAARPTC
jgi:hypothetical protein